MSNTIDTPKSEIKSNPSDQNEVPDEKTKSEQTPTEIGGRQGPEPTRYGDWEKDGKCTDF